MPEWAIRPAGPDDLDVLIALCAEHAEFEGAAYDPRGKAGKLAGLLFGRPPALGCLVAELDGRVIGYATYSPEISTWDAGRFMHMDCLYLRPEARRLGIGAALLARVAQEARRLGCTAVQWQTPIANADAIAFYRAQGAAGKEKMRFTLGL